MKALKELHVWVGWKYVEKDGKRTKIPHDINTGKCAKSDNPETWVDYNTANTNKTKYNGIGFMFSNTADYVGIDIDGANGHTENNPLQETIKQLFNGTYMELSPSGSGLHIIAKCDLSRIPAETNKEGKLKLDSNYYQKNPQNGIECYFCGLTNRYFTYTGNQVSDGNAITDQTENILKLLNGYMRKTAKSTENIIDTARRAKNGEKFSILYDVGDITAYNNDDSSADLALCNMLAFWFKGDEQKIDEAFRGSALYRQKWEREDYRTNTIQTAIKQCNGEFYKGTNRGRPRKDDKEETLDFTPEVLEEYLTEKGITVRWNDITQTVDINGVQGESKEHINANFSAILYSALQGKYKRCNINTISSYLDIVATRNKYNPVIDLLNKYEYDGKDYLSELYSILHIADDDELSRTLIKNWLWQCIAQLHNDENQPFGAEGVLVIVGAQGVGKTSLFRKLALKPEFFKEGVCLDFRDKDSYIRGTTSWIVELGEIESTFRSDIERLKAFITQPVDEYRKPYGREVIRALRRTSLCGTCNSSEFLIDTTGNRRFFTVHVDNIDLDRLRDFNAIQLWKQIEQIALADLQGFRLSQLEQLELALRNAEHEKKLKGEDEISDILNNPNVEMRLMTVTEFKELYPILHNYSVNQIGKVLDKLGYEMQKRRINGKVQKIRLLPIRRDYQYF